MRAPLLGTRLAASRDSAAFRLLSTELIAFIGANLDRVADHRRTREAVTTYLNDPAARAVVTTADGILVQRGAARAQLLLRSPTDFEGEIVLLGIDSEGPLFAIDGEGAQLPPKGKIAGLRDVATELTAHEAGIAAYASSLVGWHRTHRFCARCGAATLNEHAGRSRRCERCGVEHFPRTDPVVIVRVEDRDSLLLVHQEHWPRNLYSVPAGFVEPAETLEQAVVREIFEETGISVTACQYLGSQPWPFPSSLMLGFRAVASSGQLEPDGHEIEDARWVTRQELRQPRDNGLELPGELSIARWLIDGWLAPSS